MFIAIIPTHFIKAHPTGAEFLIAPTQTFLGFLHAFLPHERGAGTCDKPLRTSAWEAKFLRTISKFRKRNFISSLHVFVLHKTRNWIVSRNVQKVCRTCKIVDLLIKSIASLSFSLSSRRWFSPAKQEEVMSSDVLTLASRGYAYSIEGKRFGPAWKTQCSQSRNAWQTALNCRSLVFKVSELKNNNKVQDNPNHIGFSGLKTMLNSRCSSNSFYYVILSY